MDNSKIINPMWGDATECQYIPHIHIPPVIDPLQTKISCGDKERQKVGRDKEVLKQRRIKAKQGRGKIGYWSDVDR